MTIAGFFLFILCIYIYVHERNASDRFLSFVLLTLFFDLYANVGKIATIGNFELSYSDLVWLILILYSIFFALTNVCDGVSFLKIVLLIISLVITLSIEAISPYLNDNFIRSIVVSLRILAAVIVFDSLKQQIDERSYYKLCDDILILQKIIYFLAIIELITKYIFHSNIFIDTIIKVFGFGENQVNWIIQRGGLYTLQGLNKEPSHYAIMLFFSTVMDILIWEKKKTDIYIIINMILMILSASLSGMLFGALIIYVLLHKQVKSTKGSVMLVLLILAIVMFFIIPDMPITSYFNERVQNVLKIIRGNNIGYTSDQLRMGGVLESLELFKKNPLFGIGAGNNVRTGAFFTLLSTIGLIGTILFLANYIRGKYWTYPLQRGSIVAIIVASALTMDMGIFYNIVFAIIFLIIDKDCEMTYGKPK